MRAGVDLNFAFVLKKKRGEKRETGLEPATSTLGRLHSTIELLPRKSIEDTSKAYVVSIAETPMDCRTGPLMLPVLIPLSRRSRPVPLAGVET